MEKFKDRFQRLSKLLCILNPFGIVEDGDYVHYPTTKDAYLDVMLKIATICHEGFVDIVLLMALLQDVPIVKGERLCKFRSEYMKLSLDDIADDNLDNWIALLKRLLEVTGVEFDQPKFFAALGEYINIRMKQKATDVLLSKTLNCYEKCIKDCDCVATEGNQEQQPSEY